MISGVRNLSVPVFDSSGVCAMITSGYIDQTDPAATADAALSVIRPAAVELSKSLGFHLDRSPLEGALTP